MAVWLLPPGSMCIVRCLKTFLVPLAGLELWSCGKGAPSFEERLHSNHACNKTLKPRRLNTKSLKTGPFKGDPELELHIRAVEKLFITSGRAASFTSWSSVSKDGGKKTRV